MPCWMRPNILVEVESSTVCFLIRFVVTNKKVGPFWFVQRVNQFPVGWSLGAIASLPTCVLASAGTSWGLLGHGILASTILLSLKEAGIIWRKFA